MAEVHENRTHQPHVTCSPTGFEDRAHHQTGSTSTKKYTLLQVFISKDSWVRRATWNKRNLRRGNAYLLFRPWYYKK